MSLFQPANTFSTLNATSEPSKPTSNDKPEQLKLTVKVDATDIIYVQAEHVYVRLFLRDRQSILDRQSLTELESKLADQGFLRIHRSYLINLSYVTAYSSQVVLLGNRRLPISRSRKAAVLDRLKSALSDE